MHQGTVVSMRPKLVTSEEIAASITEFDRKLYAQKIAVKRRQREEYLRLAASAMSEASVALNNANRLRDEISLLRAKRGAL